MRLRASLRTGMTLCMCNLQQAAGSKEAHLKQATSSMPLEQAGPTPEELSAENLASMSFIDTSTAPSPLAAGVALAAQHVIAAGADQLGIGHTPDGCGVCNLFVAWCYWLQPVSHRLHMHCVRLGHKCSVLLHVSLSVCLIGRPSVLNRWDVVRAQALERCPLW